MDPDAALMLRVKHGDLHAFEALVQKYKHPIVNVIYRMLHDLDEAEDLAQNVFVRVFQSAGRYEASAKFSTWIFTIARHLPYDRPNTSMAGFRLCEDCAADYTNPASRRFHAETIACGVDRYSVPQARFSPIT